MALISRIVPKKVTFFSTQNDLFLLNIEGVVGKTSKKSDSTEKIRRSFGLSSTFDSQKYFRSSARPEPFSFCFSDLKNGFVSFHPTFISPHIISPHVISPHIHFTPRSFHPTFISPQIHFTPRSFHPTFKLSNASQINDYCHPIPILALIEKRLESNYQLNKQTMLAV